MFEIDENINRYCELVIEINKLNQKLQKERVEFYSGGYSFEEVHAIDIQEISELQKELKELLKTI